MTVKDALFKGIVSPILLELWKRDEPESMGKFRVKKYEEQSQVLKVFAVTMAVLAGILYFLAQFPPMFFIGIVEIGILSDLAWRWKHSPLRYFLRDCQMLDQYFKSPGLYSKEKLKSAAEELLTASALNVLEHNFGGMDTDGGAARLQMGERFDDLKLFDLTEADHRPYYEKAKNKTRNKVTA